MSLNIYLNKEVVIAFKDGTQIKRELIAYDEHHNILVKNNEGTTFYRGECIICIGVE